MRLDENLPIVPVARATEVLTRLYLWLLIQLCSCNHFVKILNDTMTNWQYEKLNLLIKKKKCSFSIKSHHIFST